MKIREMQLDDLEQVMKIENENFSRPWTETGFFTFLIRQDTLFLIAAEGEEILGYCGSCDGTGRRRYYECICEKRQAEPWYRQASGAGTDQNNE